MMASAFDGLNVRDADKVRRAILAGKTKAYIREEYKSITPDRLRDMFDEVFGPLLADPEAVKALANGRCLNPSEIIRYKKLIDRHTRMARAAAKPVQIEMFS